MFQQYALEWLLFENKGIDVEISIIVLVLVFIDEVHHFLVSTLTLFDVHLGAPFIDCILQRVENIFTGFLKRFSV